MAESDKTEIQDDDDREGARQLSLQGNAPPKEIEGYSVIRRLGAGSYGTVWLAREDHTGRMVAIKYYPHRRGLNWSLLNREVEKLATLYASRNIVRLLDVGWNAEPPYYVMEFVENGSLGAYLASGPLTVEETVRIVKQVCGALIEAHGAGVLHCDLKPDNVLLDSRFQVRLCDFGQSRMSHEQSPALGTLYYMAPEQADLEAIPDARWDVYAVGAMMFHMLTGQPPYRDTETQGKLEQAESLQERLAFYKQHIQTTPPPTQHRSIKGVDKHLAGIVDRCLAADPQERLPNAQAILSQLASRERNHSRRPLLLLGILGPLLLMAAMVPIFVRALQSNLNEMETQLLTGAQERNAQTARIQASALQEELEDRLQELQRVVERKDFVESLTALMKRPSDEVVGEMKTLHSAPMAERPPWMQKMDAAHAAADQLNDTRGKIKDTSWFLTNAEGRQLWRRNYSDKTVGNYYNWRDYFHAHGVQYQEDAVPEDARPIQEGHVSLAYRSKATQLYMVALSVPVKSEDGTVIGVIASTSHLGDLQRWLGQDIYGNRNDKAVQHVVALADRRESRLLAHPWFEPSVLDEIKQLTEDEQETKIFDRLIIDATVEQSVQEALKQTTDAARTDVKIKKYQDPIGQLDDSSARSFNLDWIAAVSTMNNEKMPWLVIVQEDKARTLEPVAVMAQRATRQAWVAVLASLGIMGLVWLFVWHALVQAKDPPVRTSDNESQEPGTEV